MPYETVDLRIEDGVAEITLNRPERLNAWNAAVRRRAARGDPRGRRRPVGAGGADHRRRARVLLGRRPQGHARAADRRAGRSRTSATCCASATTRSSRASASCPKPVVAAVNGPAVGIGCSLALACDLIWAAESAIFGLAFVNIGLVPDGGSTFLVPAAAGKARALEMALLGEPVPRRAGARLGPDQPRRAGRQADGRGPLARPAASPPGPTRSYANSKRALNNSVLKIMDEQLDLEADIQSRDGRRRRTSSRACRRSWRSATPIQGQLGRLRRRLPCRRAESRSTIADRRP